MLRRGSTLNCVVYKNYSQLLEFPEIFFHLFPFFMYDIGEPVSNAFVFTRWWHSIRHSHQQMLLAPYVSLLSVLIKIGVFSSTLFLLIKYFRMRFCSTNPLLGNCFFFDCAWTLWKMTPIIARTIHVLDKMMSRETKRTAYLKHQPRDLVGCQW